MKKFPKGLIITFEGLDCSFKETNFKEFISRLKKKFPESVDSANRNLFAESFPRYGVYSAAPVEKFLHNVIKRKNLTATQRSILYSVDRMCFWNEVNAFDEMDTMLERYKSGEYCFIFDRYITSNPMYNYTGEPCSAYPEDFTLETIQFVAPSPDILVCFRYTNFDHFLNILAKKKNKDVIEMNTEYLHSVWERFNYLIDKGLFYLFYRCKTIVIDIDDGSQIKNEKEIAEDVWNKVSETVDSMI